MSMSKNTIVETLKSVGGHDLSVDFDGLSLDEVITECNRLKELFPDKVVFFDNDVVPYEDYQRLYVKCRREETDEEFSTRIKRRAASAMMERDRLLKRLAECDQLLGKGAA